VAPTADDLDCEPPVPTRFLDNSSPVIQFDPQLEVSPFFLFRRLRDGRGPRLLDVRPTPGPRSLAGAEPYPGENWEPAAEEEVVVFDDDGSAAVEVARRLQAAGSPRVKALFGGLDLYEFCLDPEIVGQETYLVRS
jgi:hypothetical protein